MVAAIAPAASAVATYATVVSSANPITLAVTLALAIAAVAAKLRAKSASLEASDYTVLMALKQLGPSTSAQLASALNGIRIYGSGMWTDDRALTRCRT